MTSQKLKIEKSSFVVFAVFIIGPQTKNGGPINVNDLPIFFNLFKRLRCEIRSGNLVSISPIKVG